MTQSQRYKTQSLCFIHLKIKSNFVFFTKPKPTDKPLSETGRFKYGCPVDKDELGQSTWKLLHTMAAVYPDKPTNSQKDDIKAFFGIMSRAYPCDICANDLAQEYVICIII